jgi:hypothetical protein
MSILILRWPKSIARLNLSWRTRKKPITYGEHILYKMAFDRNPDRLRISDKYLAREYILERVGKTYLPEIYSVSNKAKDLFKLDNYHDEFVLKVNHGSGGVIIVSKNSIKTECLPIPFAFMGLKRFEVNSRQFDENTAIKILNYWLSLDGSYWPGSLPEWNYEKVSRLCLKEELLVDKDGKLPDDYRFYCFSGEVKLIGVDSRHIDGRKTVKHFFPEWVPVPGSIRVGRKKIFETESQILKPKHLRKMIELAQKISADLDWLRVDMYLRDDKIYIGELTNHPSGGRGKFSPKFIDNYLGEFF